MRAGKIQDGKLWWGGLGCCFIELCSLGREKGMYDLTPGTGRP